ncbi:MAG: Phosphate acetyltransferase [Alphaproteobacteria bacterium MarineAlpha5_Bin6]|nr:MAG: Phosphate acetyltransferase [Alphaproteobacteria bacterium MarineAlpha5_Bin7]PPR54109.1 MAG: Phosphate acetyltransferase [Alphaproteobacteria bacterium MarineAlpha5_Bin6]
MHIKMNNDLPENLISIAKKKSKTSVAIVCAHEFSALQSAKEAYELDLINPIFIGNKNEIQKEAEKLNWNINNFDIVQEENEYESAIKAAKLAKDDFIKVIVKGNLHTDILMRAYLKKEFNLIQGKRLSHIWHMTVKKDDKPIFITDGALNVLPRIDIKMNILTNAIEFTKKIGIVKPRVAVLSGTEDPIDSMPSSVEAKEIMKRAIKENIDAFVHGPLAFDNAVSIEAAKIKNISGEVAGKADILLVPNLETGNALCKIMVHFMGACAAGIVVGGKVPVVVASRADNVNSRLASIAASVISAH